MMNDQENPLDTPVSPEAATSLPGTSVMAEVEECPGETFGTFHVGSLEFALPTDLIREVVPYPSQVTPVPLSESSVAGLFCLRGELIPVVDLAGLLGMTSAVELDESRVAVVEQGGACLGLALDRTGEVLRPEPESLHRVEHGKEDGGEIVTGAIQRLDEGRFIQILSPEVIGLTSGSPTPAEPGREAACSTQRRTFSKAIVVRICDLEFAFRIEDVLEIHGDLPINSSPAYFEHCSGVTSLRGQSVAVMDLRSALGMGGEEPPSHYVFVLYGGLRVGLAVDALIETYEYPDDTLQDLPGILSSQVSQICSHVIAHEADRSLLTVDVVSLCGHFGVSSAEFLSRNPEAACTVAEADDHEDLAFFAFLVGEHVLCVPLDRVLEVQELLDGVVALDGSGGSGLLNLRGAVVPLIQARGILGVEDDAERPGSCALILEAQQGRFGLVIDGVVDIQRVPSNALSSLDCSVYANSLGSAAQYLSAALLAKRADGRSDLLLVLDVDSLS